MPDDVWGPDEEEGGALLLPNTNAIFFGATGFNEIYTPSGSPSIPGSWQSGPMFPNGQATGGRAPAAMMVNGRILCATGPIPTGPDDYPLRPRAFTDTTTPRAPMVPLCRWRGRRPETPTARPTDSRCSICPSGSSAAELWVCLPAGRHPAGFRTTGDFAGISPNPDGSCNLVGTLLNGISEEPVYGDDAQMDSDYPIVRMTNNTTGYVYYARTFSRSSTSIMTGTNLMSTEFSVGAGIPWGSYSLVTVANGNASAPVTFYYPDALQVTPSAGFTSYGVVGGPFTVNSQTLTLTNLGAVPINWAVNNTNSWLTVSPSGGTLPALRGP